MGPPCTFLLQPRGTAVVQRSTAYLLALVEAQVPAADVSVESSEHSVVLHSAAPRPNPTASDSERS